MKCKMHTAMDDMKMRLTAKQAAKGYYAPEGYVPMNREQRRDLERAKRKAK